MTIFHDVKGLNIIIIKDQAIYKIVFNTHQDNNIENNRFALLIQLTCILAFLTTTTISIKDNNNCNNKQAKFINTLIILIYNF